MVRKEQGQIMDNQRYENRDAWQPGIPLTASYLVDDPDDVTDERTDEQTDFGVPSVVREQLKNVIHSRMNRQDGATEWNIQDTGECGESDEDGDKNDEKLTPEDIERIERRRFLNKLAAQRCRDKKKQVSDKLTEEVLQLEARNTELRHTVRKLTREKEDLRNLLLTHFEVFHGGGTDQQQYNVDQ